MRVIIFKSEKNPQILAFTPDEDGCNLPAEHAPWRPLGGHPDRASDYLSGLGCDPVVQGIIHRGYYMIEPRC